MKATRHEMHMNIVGLKYLEQVRDEEQKSAYDTRYEQHEKTQGTGYVRYKSA